MKVSLSTKFRALLPAWFARAGSAAFFASAFLLLAGNFLPNGTRALDLDSDILLSARIYTNHSGPYIAYIMRNQKAQKPIWGIFIAKS
jgi:hypothetical protein